MPRQEYVLSAFVASPSDVYEEREKLEEIVRELNVTWSRELGVRIELIRWETHAFPGIGADPQSVINAQIPDDYDLFIGIMWHRHGTPTARAGSGTTEEFQRAKNRYDRDPSSLKIMVYFKDEAVPPSQLNVEQLARVKEFQKSLGEEGGLFFSFKSLDDFEKLLRIHLSRQVQLWVRQGKPEPIREAGKDVTPAAEPSSLMSSGDVLSEDDYGIIELMELFDDKTAELIEITERLGGATSELATKMSQKAKELDALSKQPPEVVDRSAVKRHLSLAAEDMNSYASRIEAEIPLYKEAFSVSMSVLAKTISLSEDFIRNEGQLDRLNNDLDSIIELQSTMEEAKESISGFRESVAHMPRMTGELNRARRRVVANLDSLIEEFQQDLLLLGESEKALRELLQREH